MDIRTLSLPLWDSGLINRAILSFVLVAVTSVSAIYYGGQVDRESERASLRAEMSKYERILQTELQHLIDLIYRSSERAFSPDTPAIANSFPWVRSIGMVDQQSTERDPKRNHLLTLSLAEVSRSLGGQITFAILNETDVLLVLSRADQAHTTRAIFSIVKLIDFMNERVTEENLNVNLAVKLVTRSSTKETDTLKGTLNLGMPGLDFETTLQTNRPTLPNTSDVSSLAWLMVGSLWLVWVLLVYERQRRLRQQALAAEQKKRIEDQAERSVLAEITSSIGHEINQPIAAIESLSDTASLLMENGDSSGAMGALRRIQSEALRVGQIVQTIRRLSSSQGLEFRPINIITIIHEFGPLAKMICKDVSLSIEIRTEQTQLTVSADRTAIEQVIANLIVNSYEALDDVRRRHQRKPTIELSVSQREGYVLIRVEDNGLGVPDDIKDEIFNSFVTTKNDGVGLGLNLSRTIAEKHRGWLHLVESSVQGSTFELRLPLTERNEESGDNGAE